MYQECTECLKEKRSKWFGHVQRRDKDDASRNILQVTVDGKRNRGRPKLTWGQDYKRFSSISRCSTTDLYI